jgi:predicted dehydrogenase
VVPRGFGTIDAGTDFQPEAPTMPDRVRYAVVGLGHIAQSAVLPAFEHELVALISDDPDKLRHLGRRYRVSELGDYDEFEDLLDYADVDAVYIALPNHLHRVYTERAAALGVHVLCEKPMAVTSDDCLAMIDAAGRNNVKLMVAYRLHFEPANLRAAEIAQSGQLGDVRLFDSVFTMDVAEGDIRLDRDKGGGALFDIGIYCINAARMIFESEPIEAMAMAASRPDQRFTEINEMISAILRYPDDRVASFTVNFGAHKVSRYQVVGTEGQLTLDPAYEIRGELEQLVTIGGRRRRQRYARRDQFAPELIYFSDCILDDREPEPSGHEGLNDVQIIEALHESASTGQAVPLDLMPDRLPSRRQEQSHPLGRKRKLVHTSPPSRR